MTDEIQNNGDAPITTGPIRLERRERSDGSVVTILSGSGRAPDRASQVASLLDPAQQSESRVFVRRVNDSLGVTPYPRSVLKFSESVHALTTHDEIQLCTLTHYRKGEGLDPAIRDPEEGQLTMDFHTWLKELKGSSGNGITHSLDNSVLRHGKGHVTLVPARDRWVYCTSLLPQSNREWKVLQAEFFHRKRDCNYDTATLIHDADAFALELGIKAAERIDPLVDLKQDVLDRTYCSANAVKNIVCVDHGPVVYEQRSGTPDPHTRSSNLTRTQDPCFLKNAKYSAEREYRFAIWTLGAPSVPRLTLDISSHLQDLVSDFGGGERFGFWPLTVSDVLRLEKTTRKQRRY